MTTSTNVIPLVVGAYIITLGVAILIALLAIIILTMEPHSCSTMGRALLVLWVMIAAVFLTSAAVVGVMAWKIIAGIAGRLATVVVYGVVALTSYVGIAFGLMVAFNC